MRKVLFIDSAHPSLKDLLEAAGYICDYFPEYGYEEYRAIMPHYVGIIVRSKIPVDRRLLDAASNLQFIGRVGAGMENIDVAYAHQKGINCYNVPEGNRDAVAEHAIAMLLALFTNLLKADSEVRQGIWKREENRGLEIKGKTVGIIGYGNTGAAFARKLKGFDARILAYDKYKRNFGNDYVEEVQMETIFREADILSLHIPLTEETNYLITDAYLAEFQKSIYLINTSRGPIVNTAHLISALNLGKLLGACLDVLEFEKFSFEDISLNQAPPSLLELLKRKDVILSPHIAGWTQESNQRMAALLVQKITGNFKEDE